ncbi:MAG: GNAT family N-acetyltransferase [Proteobacteria bacterium]|nr:GNAT family N-acetyltransferase [Pseudomonadota bacterium]
MQQHVYCTVVDYGSELWEQLLALRQEVLRQPLGLTFSPEELAEEYLGLHMCYREPEGPILGSIALFPHEVAIDTFHLRRVAVSPLARGQGVGKKLLSFAEHHALLMGRSKLELSARMSVLPFYEKNGYVAQGDVYEHLTIPHIKMTKMLEQTAG